METKDNVHQLPPGRVLAQDRHVEVSYARNNWNVNLSLQNDITDVERPDFWKHVAHKMKSGDLITLTVDDHSFVGEAYVRSVNPEVKIQILRLHKLGAIVETGDTFEIFWNIGSKSHDVRRRATKQTIKGGFGTREAAAEWLEAHIKQMAA